MPIELTLIAEVGSNFAGDLELAREYVRASKAAGATVVKFQTLTRDTLMARQILDDAGQLVPNPRWEAFSNIGLPSEWHGMLSEFGDQEGIEFMSTPFFLEAVDVLENAGVQRYKIASGDITFQPLLEKVGATGKPVILSTGGSSLRDIESALEWLTKSGSKVTLLHCVVSYPPQWEEMNVSAVQTLKETFGCPVGISDHSPGLVVPVMAVALGATVIEKHVTFDRSLDGPDHPFAMNFQEFAEMAFASRHAAEALGSGIKAPTEDELSRQRNYRRAAYHPETGFPSADGQGIWLRPQPPQ
jgi:N,N'-diacetyllegionaminate synthase